MFFFILCTNHMFVDEEVLHHHPCHRAHPDEDPQAQAEGPTSQRFRSMVVLDMP
jgi:hypothetical protein